jgi:bifunctional non-homologous end joining protein LigD
MEPRGQKSPPKDDAERSYEISLGGLRALAFSDSGHLEVWAGASGGSGGARADIVALFPELRDLLRQFGIRDAIFDGTISMLDPGSGRHDPDRLAWRLEQRSDSTVRKRAKQHPVTLVIGDLLSLEGVSLLTRPFSERRELLDGLELEGGAWRTASVHTGDGAGLLAAAEAQGLPAIIGKRLDSPYRPGERGRDWLRLPAAEA